MPTSNPEDRRLHQEGSANSGSQQDNQDGDGLPLNSSKLPPPPRAPFVDVGDDDEDYQPDKPLFR